MPPRPQRFSSVLKAGVPPRHLLSAGLLLAAAVPSVQAARAHRRRRTLLPTLPAYPPVFPGSHRILTLPDADVSLWRRRGSDPSLPPAVLLHGWGSSAASTYHSLAALLPCDVYAFDLPGHGRAPTPEVFSLAVTADLFVSALESLDLERPPLLMGHSLGGALALLMTARLGPDRLSGLVLSATSAYFDWPQFRAALRVAHLLRTPSSPVALWVHFRRLGMLDPELAPLSTWTFQAAPAPHVLRQAAMELLRFDASDLSGLALPDRSLFIIPADDTTIPLRHQLASARRLGVESVVVPGPHSLPFTAPAKIAELVCGMLGRSSEAAQPVA